MGNQRLQQQQATFDQQARPIPDVSAENKEH